MRISVCQGRVNTVESAKTESTVISASVNMATQAKTVNRVSNTTQIDLLFNITLDLYPKSHVINILKSIWNSF